MTRSSGRTLAGERRPGKRVSKRQPIPVRRPETDVGEWLAATIRGLDALEFLERSRDLAAESVVHPVFVSRAAPIDES